MKLPKSVKIGSLLIAAGLAAAAIGCGSGGGGDSTEAKAPAAATSVTTSAPKAASTNLRPNTDRVVTVEWLGGKTADPSVVAIDLRAKDKYEAGHIPGAVWIATADFNQKQGDITELGTADQIATALGKVGIKPTDTIIVYDDSGSLWSTRVLWSLDVYGHKDSRVLNGTWTAWAAANKPTTKDASTRAATQYAFSGSPNKGIVVNMEQMVKAVGDPSKIVCDSRTADEFTGRDLRAPAKNGGHVPGALNVAYSDAVAKSGEFLPVEELKKLYDTAGIKAADDQTIFTYCQSGIRAAHAWFVLKHLIGYQSVAVYDGSWEEWGARSDTKIEGARS